MYDYIKGHLTSVTQNSKGNFITVEACGIGYCCEVTINDIRPLCEGTDIKVYTVLIHREDKMYLCGFLHKESRDIFNILTSVSGVGTKMAFALLEQFEVSELISFVIDDNYKALTGAKGVGPKLAQKIVLELKDKLINYGENISIPKVSGCGISSKVMDEASSVLASLGYTSSEIEKAILKVSTELSPNAETEDILKKALQTLSL